MKVARVASLAGLVAGVWALLGGSVFAAQAYRTQCQPYFCGVTAGSYPVVVASLGVILVLVSIIAIVGPGIVFYGGTAVSALIAILLLVAMGSIDPTYLWTTVVLSLVSAGLSLLAARSGGVMSEQGNPMNLPVFG